MNCLGLEAEESGFVLFAEMSSPCGSEVRRMVSSVFHNEGYSVVPKVVGAVVGIGVEVGGADVKWCGG